MIKLFEDRIETKKGGVTTSFTDERVAYVYDPLDRRIGRSNFRTLAGFRDAVFERYQQFYDQAGWPTLLQGGSAMLTGGCESAFTILNDLCAGIIFTATSCCSAAQLGEAPSWATPRANARPD